MEEGYNLKYAPELFQAEIAEKKNDPVTDAP